ncbi:hypothetical protein MISHU_76 [Escherichia phage vB_EcoD_Mishu]|uniref:Uncharacterized protein n=1 Tax=Escherichia phage vB_EcoD_Mishu TaxID=2894792 RepID=A0AAE9CD59_9CAUD|nr:hypothetical protein SUPREME284_74 [Citrobacter phage vB_CfrD_Supreme284]UGO49824.1 hypothetical protein MISHU_76 [Escherichia phage vB_EcoD_Mishu]UGO53587.1 hypothetical protein DEVORATOR_71 [Citrobacter phage_vB_CfrD_Devorator]
MKVFMIKQFGSTAYYIINDEGDIFISNYPTLEVGRHFRSSVDEKGIINMVECGMMVPFNKEAAELFQQSQIRKRNRNIICFTVAMVVTVGSILLGVWA